MRLTAEQIPEFVQTVMNDRHPEKVAFINREHLITNWQVLVEGGSGVAYGIVNDAGEIGGFLLGLHTTSLITGKRTAYEFLWMVPLHEKVPNAGLRLLREFEKEARADGCLDSVIGAYAVCEPAKLRRFYRLNGYRELSESFSKELT